MRNMPIFIADLRNLSLWQRLNSFPSVKEPYVYIQTVLLWLRQKIISWISKFTPNNSESPSLKKFSIPLGLEDPEFP